MATKMVNATWEDMNGRRHKLYTVRAADGGFRILNRLRNFFIDTPKLTLWFPTRSEAWDYLRTEVEQ